MQLLEALKWPVIVLVLAVVVLVYLLPAVRGFLSRVNKFKYKDAEASADEAQAAVSAQAIAKKSGSIVIAEPHPFESSDHSYIRTEADRIAAQVRAITFASNDERDRWLFREGARQSIAIDFERLYRAVWATQMELLGDGNRPGGVTVAAAQQRYQAAALRAPQVYSNYPFGQWVGFLENFGLARYEGTNIVTTDKGSLFIQYLVAMHYDLHGLRHDL